MSQLRSEELEQLILLTKKFVAFAENLFLEGKISVEQYEKLVKKKKEFLQDIQEEVFTSSVQ